MLKPRGPLEVKESKEVAEEEERSRRARREDWAGISCLSAFHRSAGSKEVFKQQECCSGIYYKAWRDLCWFSVSNHKCSFYDGSEDQNWVAPAGSFNRNSSVIILNCERAKLCNIVCRFVPQSWTRAMIHFFFFFFLFFFFTFNCLLTYFNFPKACVTTRKRNKVNRTYNRPKVSLIK